jgi:hypothetical protein
MRINRLIWFGSLMIFLGLLTTVLILNEYHECQSTTGQISMFFSEDFPQRCATYNILMLISGSLILFGILILFDGLFMGKKTGVAGPKESVGGVSVSKAADVRGKASGVRVLRLWKGVESFIQGDIKPWLDDNVVSVAQAIDASSTRARKVAKTVTRLNLRLLFITTVFFVFVIGVLVVFAIALESNSLLVLLFFVLAVIITYAGRFTPPRNVSDIIMTACGTIAVLVCYSVLLKYSMLAAIAFLIAGAVLVYGTRKLLIG